MGKGKKSGRRKEAILNISAHTSEMVATVLEQDGDHDKMKADIAAILLAHDTAVTLVIGSRPISAEAIAIDYETQDYTRLSAGEGRLASPAIDSYRHLLRMSENVSRYPQLVAALKNGLREYD